ncbi:MAG: NAD(P)-dependent alcohol dehydrogenase [Sphingorhabdus sp.]
MTKMLSAFAIGGNGIDGVELREVAVPEPGPGEVLVRLKAATLNYRDLLFAKGGLAGMTKEPDYVPLSCGAGEVIAIGEGVTRVKIGDRVSPTFSQGWITGRVPDMAMLGGTSDGTARQYGVFIEDGLVLIPDELGYMEAATLPCAGLTAWNALYQERPLQSGEWVLCPGTGGVSLAALQFAKAAGAHVVVTSSSDAKLARAKAMGADVTINYRTQPDWPAAVRAALHGKSAEGGVDIVVDVVGAAELETHASLLNPDGIISAIGMLGSDFSWHSADKGNYPVARIMVGNRGEHDAMLAFCAKHGIRPVVDVVYDLARLPDAMRCLESGKFFGKVGVNLV